MSVWPATPLRVGNTGAGVLVFATFLALTVFHLWPLARQITTHSTPNADTVINIWWVSQMARQMLRDPLHLFDGNMLYPHPYTLATVDHMLASSIMAVPLWVTTRNPILIHNVMLFATFVLSGTFMALLVQRVSGSLLAGMVAGCAFAFCTFRWYELPHLHVLSTGWLPLAALAAHRLVEHPSRGRTAAFAGAALAVGLSSWHTAIVGGLLIGIVAIGLLAQSRGAVRPPLVAIGAVALLVALVLAPLAVPYTYTARWRLNQTDQQRARAMNRYAVSVQEFLPKGVSLGPPPEPAHGNARASWTFPGIVTWVLAASAFLPRRRASHLRRPMSRALRVVAIMAVGLLAMLALSVALGATGLSGISQMLARSAPVVLLSISLAVIAWLAARRQAFDQDDEHFVARSRRSRLIYTAVAAAGALVALGPRVSAWGVDLGSGLYRPDWIPLLAVLRAPERFGLLFAFGLAVLAGLGALRVATLLSASARTAAFVVMLVILNVDLRPAPINVGEEDQPGPGHRWLAMSPEPGAVTEVPADRWKMALFGGFLHERRMVNGVGFVYPPGYVKLWGLPEASQERLDILWEHFHPRLMLVRGRYYSENERARVLRDIEARRDAFTIIGRAGSDVILRLIDRGRGSILRRRWPRTALEKSSGLAFAAVVSGGRGTRIDRLTIALNNHSIFEVEGQATHEDVERRVLISPEWLVANENRFDIRADYRYGPGDTPVVIGQTGVSLAADLHASAADRDAWYQVNGDQRPVPPGYLLVTLDPTSGRVLERASFSTGHRQEDSAALVRFVERLPAATPVLVVSEGDVSARLSEQAVTALGALGLREDLRDRRGWAHAAIGVKGAARGTAPERVHRSRADVVAGTPEKRVVQLDGLELY